MASIRCVCALASCRGPRNHARMPHCLRWGGMASLLGGLGDRFPQHNRELPSKSPAACGGDLYLLASHGIAMSHEGLCQVFLQLLSPQPIVFQQVTNTFSFNDLQEKQENQIVIQIVYFVMI